MTRAAVVLLLILLSGNLHAQQGWRIELGTGLSYNVPLPLTIVQNGAPAIDLVARFRSESLLRPILWVWRIGYWEGNAGWELEASHNKMYLDNPPPEVGEFAISHGVNFVSINRAWNLGMFFLHAGVGVTLSHPENIVRGKKLPEDGGIFHGGYYLSGPAINASLGRSISIVGPFYLTAETRLSIGTISVPVAEGTARFTALIAQLTVAAGWESAP